MEEKRQKKVMLHTLGQRPYEILKKLKNENINRTLIYRIIKRYSETRSLKKRYGGGRKPTAVTATDVKKVKARFMRNPQRSSRKMAAKIGISPRSVRRILKDKLKTRAYKKYKAHFLNTQQKKKKN